MSRTVTETQAVIVKLLEEAGGELEFHDGRAGPIIAEALGDGWNAQRVNNMIKRLRERGLVGKEGNSKRTYRLWLTSPPEAPPADEEPREESHAEPTAAGSTADLSHQSSQDFNELAASLLEEVMYKIKKADEKMEKAREIGKKAQGINSELNRLKEENKRLKQELEEAINIADSLRSQVAKLKVNQKHAGGEYSVEDLIDEETKQQLHKLMKQRPGKT